MIFSFICLLLKNLKIPTGHFNKEKGQGKSFIFEIKSSAFYSNIGNNCCICQEDSHIENFFLSTPCVPAHICKFPPLIKDEISLKDFCSLTRIVEPIALHLHSSSPLQLGQLCFLIFFLFPLYLGKHVLATFPNLVF